MNKHAFSFLSSIEPYFSYLFSSFSGEREKASAKILAFSSIVRLQTEFFFEDLQQLIKDLATNQSLLNPECSIDLHLRAISSMYFRVRQSTLQRTSEWSKELQRAPECSKGLQSALKGYRVLWSAPAYYKVQVSFIPASKG